MSVAVDLADGVELVAQSGAVGGEAAHREHYRGIVLGSGGSADFEDLGGHAGVDAVAAGVTGVAGHDGEVGAGDGEGGAAVVGVAVSR